MTPSKRLILGVTWRDSAPLLRLRDDEEAVSRLVPAIGTRLNYRIEGDPHRTCVGHVPFRSSQGDYVDCHRRPEAGKRTCSQCSIVEATFASNLHHAHTRGYAELDPAIRDHLQQPNRLYLAAFRDGSIKVGTSTVARSQTRLEEQGAWMARFVAETSDGRAVRSLEDMVTEVWAIPQSVSARRKITGLVSPQPDSALDDQLSEAAGRVVQLVERADDDRVIALGPLDDPGEPWRHPAARAPVTDTVLRYPLKLDAGRHDLVVVGAVGRILLVARSSGDDVFAIDPAPLFGVELDIGDYGSDEIAIQDSLF